MLFITESTILHAHLRKANALAKYKNILRWQLN